MPSQFSLLNRKTFTNQSNITWYSEPMYWGGFQRCEAFLSVYGINDSSQTAALTFEGSNEPGFNAVWTTVAAGTPADPAALSATGVNRYVRDGTLYPYIRLKVAIGGGSGIKGAEVSLDGSLFEQSSQ